MRLDWLDYTVCLFLSFRNVCIYYREYLNLYCSHLWPRGMFLKIILLSFYQTVTVTCTLDRSCRRKKSSHGTKPRCPSQGAHKTCNMRMATYRISKEEDRLPSGRTVGGIRRTWVGKAERKQRERNSKIEHHLDQSSKHVKERDPSAIVCVSQEHVGYEL